MVVEICDSKSTLGPNLILTTSNALPADVCGLWRASSDTDVGWSSLSVSMPRLVGLRIACGPPVPDLAGMKQCHARKDAVALSDVMLRSPCNYIHDGVVYRKDVKM